MKSNLFVRLYIFACRHWSEPFAHLEMPPLLLRASNLYQTSAFKAIEPRG